MKIVFLAVFLSSCAGMMRDPLPIAQRTTEFEFKHELSKKEAFIRAKFWLPTNINSDGQLIKAEDINSGMIAGAGHILCKEIVYSFMSKQFLGFNFTVRASENTVKIKFGDQIIFIPDQYTKRKEDNIFNDKTQIEGVGKCLSKLGDSLKNAL